MKNIVEFLLVLGWVGGGRGGEEEAGGRVGLMSRFVMEKGQKNMAEEHKKVLFFRP